MIKYCPRCGEPAETGSAFCVECGEALPPEPMLKCPICGEMNKPKARFCKKCGEKIVHPSDMVICPECDEVSYESADFCMYCGEKFFWEIEEETPCADYAPHEKIGCVEPSFRDSFRDTFAKSAQISPKPVKKKLSGWGILAIVGLVLVAIYVMGSNSDSDPVPDVSSSAQTMSASEYKASCQTFAYDDIARNPNQYIGKKAVFTGEVIQVVESGNFVVLRVNVTESTYSWTDTVYVNYRRKSDDESRILEDDIITMYGELAGIKEYTSALGVSISIPSFTAAYIEIQ